MAVISAPSNLKRAPKQPTQDGVKMHDENICRIAKYELHVLQHIRKHLSADNAKILFSGFIKSQFHYVVVIARYRVQYEKYFASFSCFAT